VTCVLSYEGELFLVFSVGGQLSETRVTADNTGYFQTDPISLDTGTNPSKVIYKVTCTATNARGQESDPVVVTFKK